MKTRQNDQIKSYEPLVFLLVAAGLISALTTDIDQYSCDTLNLNVGQHFNSKMKVECSDIMRIELSNLPSGIDLVIGGPPCQSFSASGRRAGGAAGRLDQRGRLFEAYCKIINYVQPKAFLFENVRGILATNKGEDWKAIIEAFSRIGYLISYRILDALDYGAPQQRERIFLVGHKLKNGFLFPEPTHGPDSISKQPHFTAGEALSGIDENEDLSELVLSGGKYSHLLPLVPPGQNYLFFTAKRGYPKPIFAYRSRFSDFLYKADPESPVKTIIASPGKYTGPLHWENRYFSVKEYMRLQGFPDDFKLSGQRADKIRQIGNSVSPYVAYQMALAIAEQIFEIETGVRLISKEKNLSFDKRKSIKAKKTREIHARVALINSTDSSAELFSPIAYSTKEKTYGSKSIEFKVKASLCKTGASIRINTDSSSSPFAKMSLKIRQSWQEQGNYLRLNVIAYGQSASTAQAMWAAVDEWVRLCSNFHSLFELYGHFTEPHPLFEIEKFTAYSSHPVAIFAEHAANFKNCSRYLPKSHLVKLFKSVLKTDNFAVIADYLRQYRFDIRSNETNIAIAKNYYMVAYPFNLPAKRQMNFKVKNRVEENTSEDVGALA